MDLPGDGDAVDLAVDSTLDIVVVAAGDSGVHFVDVVDPMTPKLDRTISIAASQVEIVDGVAYVATRGSLRAYDVRTGEQLDTLPLGGNQITGLAREGLMLYTMDSGGILTAVDISDFAMRDRGTLPMSDAGGKLFVGNAIVYAAATSDSQGGFTTADVSDPDNPVLLSASDVTAPVVAPKTAIVANGSGTGLLVGSSFAFRSTHSLNLMNVSDPTNTNSFQTRIDLPSSPSSVTIAAGIGFVAGGDSGLHVVNYVPFDNRGEAPAVTINATNVDLDPDVEGIQVLEGMSVPIIASIMDDVQVRNVELLVNGVVVSNDVSFPFDFRQSLYPLLAM